MTNLHADSKAAAATNTREPRPATSRDDAHKQEKPAPRARPVESHEQESYNLPFTD